MYEERTGSQLCSKARSPMDFSTLCVPGVDPALEGAVAHSLSCSSMHLSSGGVRGGGLLLLGEVPEMERLPLVADLSYPFPHWLIPAHSFMSGRRLFPGSVETKTLPFHVLEVLLQLAARPRLPRRSGRRRGLGLLVAREGAQVEAPSTSVY